MQIGFEHAALRRGPRPGAGRGRRRVLRRVFITGCLGFIGGALAERFRSLGAEVRGVDLRADPARVVVAGDVSQAGAWQEHAAGCDLVLHTAARVSFGPG